MAKIVSQCPHCSKKFRLPQEKRGKKVKCPNCAGIFRVEECKPNQKANTTQTYRSSNSSSKTRTYSDTAHSSKKTKTYSNAAQDNTTQIYSQAQPSSTTQTYGGLESEPAYIYDLTQHYGSSSELPGKLTITTTHNLAIGDVVVLNDVSYTITGIISEETGEAVIYTIQDSNDAVLALKLYFEFPNPRDEPNSNALERIKQINDPDILRLHDFGTGANKYQGKYCFEICDFAKGGNLLEQNHYSLAFITDTIIPQIFNGIQTLHTHKIYHCDLKPENILWLDEAQTDMVIGDYGSAKTFEETSEKILTHTSTTKGTNFYIAPEQPRGVVSEKNDYYSFGMILLHLVYPQYVSHQHLHKIIERQHERKPIVDYNSEYRAINNLIAGLTLADLSARWGQIQVLQWMRGEDIAVSYGHSTDVHPIKLGKTPIRTPQDLIKYIESNADWYDDLIEDSEGYGQLLRWIADIEDLGRKKVFDKMVRNYQQDGKEFLKTAILRYFDPERPVHLDMKVYDFWNSTDIVSSVNQYWQHFDNICRVTSNTKLKLHLLQVEFALRQLEAHADAHAKPIIRSIFNKIEGILNVSPKRNFDDYVCQWYHNIPNDIVLPVLLYTFDQNKTLQAIFSDFNSDIDAQLRKFGFSGNLTSVYEYLFNLAKNCAEKGDIAICLPLLKQLIYRESHFFQRTQQQDVFVSRKAIADLLNTLHSEAFQSAERTLTDSENLLSRIKGRVHQVEDIASKTQSKYETGNLYQKAKDQLIAARHILASREYTKLLGIPDMAKNIIDIANRTEAVAQNELVSLKEKHQEQVKEEWTNLGKAILAMGGVLLGAFIIGFVLINLEEILGGIMIIIIIIIFLSALFGG